MLTDEELKNGYREGIIYMYVCLCNLKVYIGQTIRDESTRINEHKNASGSCPLFHEAINKYGWKNFSYKVLFKNSFPTKEIAIEKLNELEIYYIKYFNSTNPDFGYNISIGGSSGDYHMTPILILDLEGNIIREFNSVRIASIETGFSECSIKIHCSGRNNSNHVDKEGRVWIYKHQYEELKNIFPLTNNFIANGSRAVIKLTEKGYFISRFDSVREAADDFLKECTKYSKRTLQSYIASICNRSPLSNNRQLLQKLENIRWMWESDWILNGHKALDLIEEEERIPINSRTVIMMDLEENEEMEFISIKQAVLHLFPDLTDNRKIISKSACISEACNSSRKSGELRIVFNHKWKHKYPYRNDKNLNQYIKNDK